LATLPALGAVFTVSRSRCRRYNGTWKRLVEGAELAMQEVDQINIADLQPLPDEKYDNLFSHCVDEVAANLIGMFISYEVSGSRLGGQIIETEAYCQYDTAAHCNAFITGKRHSDSWPMSLPGGHIYVFPSMVRDSKDDPKSTWCLNLTCGFKDFGSAVLIRALRPTPDSIEGMKSLRGAFMKDTPNDLILCNGPGKLHEALGLVGDDFNGELISKTPLKLHARIRIDVTVKCGRRWNISVKNPAVGWPRSYILDDQAAVKFLSDGGKKISKEYGRETVPSDQLRQLKKVGLLAKCNCTSEDL